MRAYSPVPGPAGGLAESNPKHFGTDFSFTGTACQRGTTDPAAPFAIMGNFIPAPGSHIRHR